MTDAQKLKEHLWARMSDSPFMMMGLTGGGQHSEPLTVQLDRDQVDTLWFFIGKDNRLAGGGAAMGQFVSKGHDFFACLAGRARIDNDPAMIDNCGRRRWKPGSPVASPIPILPCCVLTLTRLSCGKRMCR